MIAQLDEKAIGLLKQEKIAQNARSYSEVIKNILGSKHNDGTFSGKLKRRQKWLRKEFEKLDERMTNLEERVENSSGNLTTSAILALIDKKMAKGLKGDKESNLKDAAKKMGFPVTD